MDRIFIPLIARHRKVVAAVTIAAASSNAMALGGLDKAKTAADDIKTGLYALVGVVALIYLIYLGVMAFTEKKSWADFGWGVVYVSVVGGAAALGGWAWSLFT
ncbi:TrbC/VirB2 family protein [Herbaspirillum seropedicae]|uniref:TrbC/VirB2 family protein n=1 Tax=Herbaspirillum seropedicae TaxID=964 RepID=UPI003D99FC15